jgi:hypothetical protein
MRQRDFIEAALRRLDMGPTDLGEALGKRNAYQQVRGWITGKYRLDIEDAWQILKMCDWLTVDAGEPVPQERTRLERLEDLLTQLVYENDEFRQRRAPGPPPAVPDGDLPPSRSSRT